MKPPLDARPPRKTRSALATRALRLRPRWSGARASAREVVTLRALFPSLQNVPLSSLRARARAGEVFESEMLTRTPAAALVERARAKGLTLEPSGATQRVQIDDACWIPDGAGSTPFARGSDVAAVGWLSPIHPYERGRVAAATIERLAGLLAHPARWLPFVTCGFHTCEFCFEAAGSQALLVPGRDVLFVAPDLVVHYIRRHEYAPPEAFLRAADALPTPGSPPYFAALRRFQALWPQHLIAPAP